MSPRSNPRVCSPFVVCPTKTDVWITPSRMKYTPNLAWSISCGASSYWHSTLLRICNLQALQDSPTCWWCQIHTNVGIQYRIAICIAFGTSSKPRQLCLNSPQVAQSWDLRSYNKGLNCKGLSMRCSPSSRLGLCFLPGLDHKPWTTQIFAASQSSTCSLCPLPLQTFPAAKTLPVVLQICIIAMNCRGFGDILHIWRVFLQFKY